MTTRSASAMTMAEVAALPTALDVETAARLLGVGRTCAYELVRTGRWPTPVLRVGRAVRIPTAPLLATLGLQPPHEPDRQGSRTRV
jgi:excisionase family DNA binding protein